MNALVLLFSTVLTVVLTPVKPKEPAVQTTDTPGIYRLVNPLAAPVSMTVTCGFGFEPVEMKLAPQQRLEVQFVAPPEANRGVGACYLDSWRKAAKEKTP